MGYSYNLERVMKKVKAIAREPNADLLLKLIDLLYDREMMEREPEYFAPEELVDPYLRTGSKPLFALPLPAIKLQMP